MQLNSVFNTETSDIINILVNYFRFLANSNIEIATFKTGYEFDENHTNNTSAFPLLSFGYPVSVSYDNPINPETGLVTYNFTIYIYNNAYLVNNQSNATQLNQISSLSNLNYISNQNEVNNLIHRDSVESRCNRIANQIVTKFLKDIKNYKGIPLIKDNKYTNDRIAASVSNYITIETNQYETSSVVAKSTINISISVSNTFYCDIEDYFTKQN